MSLRACDRCDGWIPRGGATCPHCEAPVRRGARWLARAAMAGGALMTLMACYGMMPRPYDPSDNDADRDGVPTGTDCDDARPDVYPGAADQQGDAVDQNCDGVDGWAAPSAPPAPPPAAVATDPDAPPPAVLATDPP
jgi:Putative metal-binding motif